MLSISNIKMTKHRVVVIGHGYTSRLGIIRSLSEIGCDITVIVMVFHNSVGRFLRFEGDKPIDCCSKFVKRFLYCYAKSETDLVHLLVEKCADEAQKTVIIPDSDFSAAVIDKYQKELEEHFLFPNISHTVGAVEYWMRKTTQKELARLIGLPVAQGTTIQISNHEYSIPNEVKFPCFTKPLETINGGKQLLRKCSNEADLKNLLDYACRLDVSSVLVEEYKSIDNEYAVLGFSNGSDVVIPAVVKFIANSKSHFGIAREGIIMPTSGFEHIISQFQEFLKHIGFFGLFDIDFFESDGVFYFGELNLRFGGSGYAVTKMGVNLPAMFVKAICGEEYDSMQGQVCSTAVFVNERMCVDDWSFYYISWEEYREITQRADILFVKEEDDDGPQKQLNRYVAKHRIKRVIRRFIKR